LFFIDVAIQVPRHANTIKLMRLQISMENIHLLIWIRME